MRSGGEPIRVGDETTHPADYNQDSEESLLIRRDSSGGWDRDRRPEEHATDRKKYPSEVIRREGRHLGRRTKLQFTHDMLVTILFSLNDYINFKCNN